MESGFVVYVWAKVFVYVVARCGCCLGAFVGIDFSWDVWCAILIRCLW